MAGNFSQDNVEEDASDLCFPKDKKVTASSSSQFSMKTIKVFEKLPPLQDNPHLKFGINFLISVSGENWFMWNGQGNSILSGSIAQIINYGPVDDKAEGSSSSSPSYEEWPLTTKLPFEVSSLVAHPSQHGLIILWGQLGVAIVKISLPLKSDAKAVMTTPSTKSSSSIVSCQLVGEKVYLDSPKIRTFQVKWHPDTPSKLIVVLHNDYYLRFYDAENPRLPITSICVGPPLALQREIGDHEHCDGEVPVDFDFGPQLTKSNFWVVFILRESGAIYYVLARILKSSQQSYTEIHGPLNVSGELDDKLSSMGSKSTCLVSTKNFPIVLITGNLSNSLQHALLLPDDVDTDECNMEEKLLSADLSLYIREKIILETVSESDISYMTLVPDPAIEHRYVCVTETGIYLVNINFIPELRSFLKNTGGGGGGGEDSKLLLPIQEQELSIAPSSSVRFLLCWKINDKTKPDRCLAGLTFCDTLSQKLLIILGDLRAIACDIRCSISSLFPDHGKDDNKQVSPFPKLSNNLVLDEEDVLHTINDLLHKKTNQPFMFSTQDVEGDDLEKFAVESIDLLLREYIERQEEAMHFLQSSINTLNVKTVIVKDNLEELSQTRQELRGAAESIAEQYEERAYQNEDLQRRLEATLHRQQQSLPSTTIQEQQWKKQLINLQKDVEVFKKWIESIKLKVEVEKKEDVNESDYSYPKLEPIFVAEVRTEIMKHVDSIHKLTREIKDLQQTVNNL